MEVFMTTLESREAGRLRRVGLPSTFLRVAAVNLAGLGLLFMAWISGAIQEVYVADGSRLSIVIAAVFVAGLVICLRAAWRQESASPVRFIANSLVVLGLIGTVVGFIRALDGVNPSAAGDAAQTTAMVSALVAGMGVALYTTLVGSVLGLWLLMNHWLIEGWRDG